MARREEARLGYVLLLPHFLAPPLYLASSLTKLLSNDCVTS